MAERKRRPRPSSSLTPHLIIMAKSPIAGRVKRRLAAGIGSTAATSFYRACLLHTLLRLGKDPRWRTTIAVTPDGDMGSRLWMRIAGPRIARVAQGEGDLGTRMQRVFRALPPGPAIIVGTDIPAISAREVGNAFCLLRRADAVFGGASDGGYWLVGLKRRPKLLSPFTNVRWSSDKALADTLRNLKGNAVAFAAMLGDIDDAESWRGSRRQWQRLVPPRKR